MLQILTDPMWDKRSHCSKVTFCMARLFNDAWLIYQNHRSYI